MAKIKKITVSNLKAISNLEIDFKGCTAIVTGGNNKGKSSFLRSLSDRLKGIKPEMIVKQGEREGFYEMELTNGEKFKWEFNNTRKLGEKLTFISTRNIETSLTKEAMKYYFPATFDVDVFLSSAPKKQKEILQKLSDIDFSEFDQIYKAAYENRTYANKHLAEEKARAEYIDTNLPAEFISTEELEKEYISIDSHNLKFKTIAEKLEDKKAKISANNAEIDRISLLMENLAEENVALNKDILSGEDWIADDKNKPKTNAEELKREIETIKAQNAKIQKNNEAKLQDQKIIKAQKSANDADAEVKKLESEKADYIKNSSLPDGFGFTDDGITYKGFDFTKEQLSSSGIYIAALKLAAMGLGEVKTLHFDASFLDKNSLAEIEIWANENDLQLLIERPDFEGGEIEYQIIEPAN